MYSILVCAAAGVAVFLVLLALKLAWWIALLIGVVIFTASFVVLSRIIIKKVMVALESAGKDLQGQRFEKAIRVMKDALR